MLRIRDIHRHYRKTSRCPKLFRNPGKHTDCYTTPQAPPCCTSWQANPPVSRTMNDPAGVRNFSIVADIEPEAPNRQGGLDL